MAWLCLRPLTSRWPQYHIRDSPTTPQPTSRMFHTSQRLLVRLFMLHSTTFEMILDVCSHELRTKLSALWQVPEIFFDRFDMLTAVHATSSLLLDPSQREGCYNSLSYLAFFSKRFTRYLRMQFSFNRCM